MLNKFHALRMSSTLEEVESLNATKHDRKRLMQLQGHTGRQLETLIMLIASFCNIKISRYNAHDEVVRRHIKETGDCSHSNLI